jgi:hypothetical protein
MASTRSKLDEIVESVSAVDDPRFQGSKDMHCAAMN